MDSWIWTWLLIIIVTLLLELATVGLTAIWMTAGALVAGIVCVLGGPLWLQVVVFFVVTFLLLYFTRPWALKFVNSRRVNSNYEETIGREVRIIERVDNRLSTGKAIYNGMEWTARAKNDEDIFEPDEMAVVTEIEGVKLILAKRESSQNASASDSETKE